MTKIRLQSIAINNFKKTRYLLLNLNGKNTRISGANGSGKTTVYKAYYWCLTGKTLEPNEEVQMLDENNEIIHKVVTSVLVTLNIDDSYDVTLERRLTEDWKALGQPDEQLKGTIQTRFFNDVPLQAKEFDAKLNSICDLKTLLLLSDITAFMGLKMEERRKLLLSTAGGVDEAKLMAPFPALLKAVAEKKTVEELKIQTLSTKKRANEELKLIPSRIDAQEKLRSTEDFEALRKEKEKLDMKIQDCEAQLKGSTETLQAVREYNERIAEIEERLAARKKDWLKENLDKTESFRRELAKAQNDFHKVSKVKMAHEQEQAERLEKKVKLVEKFESVKTQWIGLNEQEFIFDKKDSCPVCGHKFTEEEKVTQREAAVKAFNTDKAEELMRLQKEAEQINQQITVLTGSINEYNKITKPQDDNASDERQKRSNEVYSELSACQRASYMTDEQYIAIEKELESARSEKKPTVEVSGDEEVEKQKKELTARRDEVTKLLVGEDTNRKIDEEKERLGDRSRELAQIVANCDDTLSQIADYQKAKVDAVELNVNSWFKLARWKFFEKNMSNDDLKEVCICHHNGVDYNSTNGADKINLGIDIVSGLGKALGIDAPIFVDSAESVGAMLQTRNQLITLEHVKDAPFTFNNF